MKKILLISLLLLPGIVLASGRKSKNTLTDTLVYQRDSLFIEALRLENLNYSDSAFDAVLAASEIDPDNAAICYELGKHVINTDFNKGYAFLRRASELSPDNYYYQRELIGANMYKGDIEAVIAGYEALIKKYPDHEEDIYQLARLYTRIGDYDNALKNYERLEKLTGMDRYISLSKIGIYLEQNNYKKVLKALDNLIENMPLDASLLAYKGDIYMETKDLDQAYECYQKSLAIDSLNGYALESIYIYYIRTGETGLANEYFIKLLSSNEISFKTKRDYLNQMSKYISSTNRPFSDLEPYYKAIVDAEPDNADAKLMYAEFLIASEREAEAVEELRSAIYVNPKCQDCWEFLLYQVAQGSDTIMIEKTLSDALDAIPESADFYYYSGIWEQYKQEDEKALEYLLKADSIVSSTSGKSLSKDRLKDMWIMLSNIYYKFDDKNNYYFYLEKIVDTFPDEMMGLNNYAYILAVDDQYLDKADSLSKITIDKEPLNYVYLDTYAYILMKRGKLSYAKFYIEQAIEYMRDEVDPIVYEHYGDILFFLGDNESALEQWRKSFDLGIGSRSDKEYSKLLEKIVSKEYVK